jgi:hypothetical protein
MNRRSFLSGLMATSAMVGVGGLTPAWVPVADEDAPFPPSNDPWAGKTMAEWVEHRKRFDAVRAEQG